MRYPKPIQAPHLQDVECHSGCSYPRTPIRPQRLFYLTGWQVNAAQILGIPTIFTEQYPKAFEHTGLLESFIEPRMLLTCAVDELQEFLKPNDPNGFDVYEKTQFSMLDPEHVHKYPEQTGVSVIFGIEAHICVQQTVLDLLDEGEIVYVVADAVSSQRSYDRGIALAVRKVQFHA